MEVVWEAIEERWYDIIFLTKQDIMLNELRNRFELEFSCVANFYVLKFWAMFVFKTFL